MLATLLEALPGIAAALILYLGALAALLAIFGLNEPDDDDEISLDPDSGFDGV